MSNYIKTAAWSFNVSFDNQDRYRLKRAIGEELAFYNSLVTKFGGPIRSMGATLAFMNGRVEQAFALLTGMQLSLSSLKRESIPKVLEPFADVLFDAGKVKLDDKTQMIFDFATTNGDLPSHVRMTIATEVLRSARQHAGELKNNEIFKEDQVLKHPVSILVPLNANEKRHLQLPRFAVKVSEKDDEIEIQLPYVAAVISANKPTFNWNHVVIREELDGKWSCELSHQSRNYLAGKTDYVPRKPKRKR